MANTIIEYISQYGEMSFDDRAFSNVDSLVLCQLCYLKFDGIVPGPAEGKDGMTLKQIAESENFENLFTDKKYEKQNRSLMEALLNSKRFETLLLNYYVSITDLDTETQFSALTYILPDGTPYIAFRGTDETIVGWKEDFNCTYMDHVKGHILAVNYLNGMASIFDGPIYVGGHSKGGNLSVYASMNCDKMVQDRIIKIYSMDGPSFRPQVLEKCHFEDIKDRLVKILPHSSLIGMMFETGEDYIVIKSYKFSLLQHDPYNWVVKDGEFVEVDKISSGAKFLESTINGWINSATDEQRRVYVDTLYGVLEASEASSTREFAVNAPKKLSLVMSAMKELDEGSSEAIRETTKLLTEVALNQIENEVQLVSSEVEEIVKDKVIENINSVKNVARIKKKKGV